MQDDQVLDVTQKLLRKRLLEGLQRFRTQLTETSASASVTPLTLVRPGSSSSLDASSWSLTAGVSGNVVNSDCTLSNSSTDSTTIGSGVSVDRATGTVTSGASPNA